MKRVIRIAGGVGAGKSQVLSILEKDYGAKVILADLVAKRLMEPGQPAFLQVVRTLGEGILDESGAIDREKMAGVIFADENALAAVNGITHPLTWRAITDEVNASGPLVVVEAAVMDSHEPDIFDERWFVFASRETRIRRLMENRGYSREKSLAIMERQLPPEEFRRRCQVVIDNDGSLENTRAQIKAVLEKEGF